jgi:hypothetical protein
MQICKTVMSLKLLLSNLTFCFDFQHKIVQFTDRLPAEMADIITGLF